MKKIIALCAAIIISIGSLIAVAQYSSLDSKLDDVANKIQLLINKKWDSFRTKILWVLATYHANSDGDETRQYVFKWLINRINTNNQTNNASLSDSDYLGSYTINDDTYGTYTVVTIDWNYRTIKTNNLPNHSVWTFPNSWNPNEIEAQDLSYSFPLYPVPKHRLQHSQEKLVYE